MQTEKEKQYHDKLKALIEEAKADGVSMAAVLGGDFNKLFNRLIEDLNTSIVMSIVDKDRGKKKK